MFLFKRHSKLNQLFISVGAGFNQIPLITEAKKAGFHVIGIDQNCTAAGLLQCDIRIQESIVNYEEIYKKIQELLIDGEIKGALTRSFGSAVKSVAFINEKMGLDHIPLDRIEDLIDKKKMKTVFHKNRIPTPSMNIVRESSRIKTFPCVIKPLKGHAKNGVRYLKDSSDAKNYFSNSAPDSEYIVEKFIKGDEVIASGICKDGRFTLIELTDKIISPLPYFVDIQHSSPSKYIDRWEEIESIGQQIADSFEIKRSPLLFEIRIDNKFDIFVVEAIPDFGGEFLADYLIPARSGFNFLRQSVLTLIGKEVVAPSKRKYKKAVVVRYITADKDGVFSSFTPLSRKKPASLLYSAIFKDVGSEVRRPETNHDRIGVVITKGNTVDEAASEAEKIIKLYNIKIKESRTK